MKKCRKKRLKADAHKDIEFGDRISFYLFFMQLSFFFTVITNGFFLYFPDGTYPNGRRSEMRKSQIIGFMTLLWVVFIPPYVSAIEITPGKSGTEKEIVASDLGKKLDLYLTRITPFGFSGALLVAKDNEVILNKGYGMAIRSENVPNTSETVFSTGSITKQFTAAGIMKLEMMGKLKSEDLITQYFDDVPEDKKAITLHHLLTHTSGVVDALGPDYVTAPRDETARKTLDAPLRFQPGEQFGYSNAGYSLLAAVIEKVSGQSYEEFMHEHLFAPSGMKFTGYRIPDWNKKVVAHWYREDKDNGTPIEKNYPQWHLLGNGGILSTTEDMLRWHQALLEDKVLSPEVKHKMFTPFLNEYGYGWDIIKREMGTLIQHDGGSMLGSSAEMRRYIDAGIVTMIFCNQSFGQRALFEVVRDKIETIVFGGDVPFPPEISSFDPGTLHKYSGVYRLETGGKLLARQRAESLVISADGQDAVNVLFDPTNPDPAHFEELNDLSRTAFEAAIKGDYTPMGNILMNKDQRLSRVKELIQTRLDMYKARTGEIKSVKPMATLPSTLDGEKAAVTYVQLEGEKGSLFFELYWQDGKNIGVGPMPPPGDMTLSFLPLSKTEFAGYSIDAAINTRIGFKKDATGSIVGLVLPGKESFVALKEK
jgi:CubicO group peptidase (beta-lactamase class C family)